MTVKVINADPIWIADEDVVEDYPAANNEAPCSRSTFFVNFNWEFTTRAEGNRTVHGKMYVECLKPCNQTQQYPVIFIHGDYHTGQVWLNKPDNGSGWTSDFLNSGYTVYIVDLPLYGRSNFLSGEHDYLGDLAVYSKTVPYKVVERELTAPAKVNTEGWPTAPFHNKWPGTGRAGDPIFDNYYASLVSLPLDRLERQKTGQAALANLLRKTGKAVLIGQGTGATMAWLAADTQPALVAGVIAVEPTGPPYGSAHRQTGRARCYSQMIRFDATNKPYGLADIPLTFYPPAKLPPKTSKKRKNFFPLDITMLSASNNEGTYMMQDDSELIALGNGQQVAAIRKLVNLQKMPHVVVTSHAGSHSVYDWASACFMEQAGLSVDRMKLENFGIRGNGHLMFLETNSHQISKLLQDWIQNTAATFEWVPAAPPAPEPATSGAPGPTLDMSGYVLPTGQRSQSEIDQDMAMDQLMCDYEDGSAHRTIDGLAPQRAVSRAVPHWKTEIAPSVKEEASTENMAATPAKSTPPRNFETLADRNSRIVSPVSTIAPNKAIDPPPGQSSSQQQVEPHAANYASRQTWRAKQEAFLAPNDITGYNPGLQNVFATANQGTADAFMGFCGNSLNSTNNMLDIFPGSNQFHSYPGLGQAAAFNNMLQPQMSQFNNVAPFANMLSPNTPTSMSDFGFANSFNSTTWPPTNHSNKFNESHCSPTPDSRMQRKKARN